MDVTRISGLDDPRLALYRGISDAKLMREHGLFVAEGRLVVERVIRDRRYRLASILVNAAARLAMQSMLEDMLDPSVPVLEIPAPAFETLTGYNIHRGCLALVHRPADRPWREAVGSSGLVVVLEDVANADNVGGVFRNAAAFGAGAVLLSPATCDPFYRKAVRTSMGAALQVPFARLSPWPGTLHELRTEGFRIVALTPRYPSFTLDEFVASERPWPVALMIGTEDEGITHDAERFAHFRVRIPIARAVDSLNLSVASGIALSRLSYL
jgi:tRNA G18 (ribose-2'-O)-methylase SpoU